MSSREDIFKSTSSTKSWSIYSDDGAFSVGNSNIISESISIKQSLCSENELLFGSCNAETFEFSIINDDGASLLDTKINVITTISNYGPRFSPPVIVTIGQYKIIEDDLSSDRRTRKLKAVNSMYYLLNENVSDWYNNLNFPMTIKAFRTAFFDHLESKGIFHPYQEEIDLINDNMAIEKTIDSTDITGAMVIRAICEINGVFGRVSEYNEFKYVSLTKEYGVFNLYPSEDLYPSEELYPSSQTVADEYTFTTDEYFAVDYANYRTKPISKVIVRMEENDIGATVGVDGNTYVVQDNFLCYGMDASHLEAIANNLLTVIGGIEYTPIKSLTTYGNPYLKVGDAIGVMIGNRKYIKSYILERTLTGVHALKDSYVANGVESYEHTENNTTAFLNQLRAKTAKVEANVEGVAISVTDLAEQTEASLELKVGKDENDQVVSMINASADVVSLKGNRVEIESDNFKLDRAGNVSANGTFTSVKSDTVNAQLQGNGVHIFNNDSEIGTVGGTTTNGMTLRGGSNVSIGDTNNNVYYMCNNGTNPSGLTERHLFLSGTSRFSNRVYLGASGTASIGSIDYADVKGVGIYNSAYVYGSLGCSGTKYRVVDTESYGKRGMNAYETAYAQFGDNGSGACDDKGLCEIEFEPIFAETIDLSKPYQVFITQTSEKVTKWVEKKADRFIVHGEPGATFDYMVVARQKGYADVRLEEIDIPSIESEVTE